MSVPGFDSLLRSSLILSGGTVLSALWGPIETVVPLMVADSNNGVG